MNRKKWLSSLVMLLTLALMLAACSGGGSNGQSGNSSGGQSGNADQTTGSSSSGEKEDTYHAVMAIPMFQAEPKDFQMVEDEINRIMKEKINATVDIMPIPIGNWMQQMNLMLSSGEKLDLLFTSSSMGYSSQAATGKLAPLNDLLAGPGKVIVENVGEKYINATKIAGESYGVPTIRDLAANYEYVMRKDLVDKYNIDLTSIRTFDDIERVLEIIKTNEPDIVPIAPGAAGNGGMLVGYNAWDSLGDGFGVLMDPDSLVVSNLYESEEYREIVTRMHDWYKKGYILRDAATNQIVANQLVKAGKVFSYLGNGKPGFAEQESRAAGMELVTVEIRGPFAATTNVTGLMWSIAQQSENKEKAMEILSLFYSDKEIIDLINWGIEGVHYVRIGDNLIDFAEGLDASTTGYMPNWDWLTGNAYLTYVFKGGDPEVWEKTKVFNESAKASKALGFTFNADPVKTEYTAVTNVVDQYKVGLESGTLDPEKTLPEFIQKLKAAGIDKIIEEKQRQLDEWAQQNNVK